MTIRICTAVQKTNQDRSFGLGSAMHLLSGMSVGLRNISLDWRQSGNTCNSFNCSRMDHFLRASRTLLRLSANVKGVRAACLARVSTFSLQLLQHPVQPDTNTAQLQWLERYCELTCTANIEVTVAKSEPW